MYNAHRGGKSGGWKGSKPAGRGGSWKKGFDSQGSAHPVMHNSTCSKCGNSCQVPFKPNGSKPVLCRDCFQKDGNFAPKRFGGAGPARPSFRESRPFATAAGSPAMIDRQFKEINEKLDAILRALAD